MEFRLSEKGTKYLVDYIFNKAYYKVDSLKFIWLRNNMGN